MFTASSVAGIIQPHFAAEYPEHEARVSSHNGHAHGRKCARGNECGKVMLPQSHLPGDKIDQPHRNQRNNEQHGVGPERAQHVVAGILKISGQRQALN